MTDATKLPEHIDARHMLSGHLVYCHTGHRFSDIPTEVWTPDDLRAIANHIDAQAGRAAADERDPAWMAARIRWLEGKNGELGEELAEQVSLIRHMQIHSGYSQNGRQQMTTPQRALYDRMEATADHAAPSLDWRTMERSNVDPTPKVMLLGQAAPATFGPLLCPHGKPQPTHGTYLVPCHCEATGGDAVEIIANAMADVVHAEVNDGFRKAAREALADLRAIGWGPSATTAPDPAQPHRGDHGYQEGGDRQHVLGTEQAPEVGPEVAQHGGASSELASREAEHRSQR